MMKKIWIVIILLLALTTASQAQVVTFLGGSWSAGTSWSTGSVPISGSDSLVLSELEGRADLNVEFTIGNGQSITCVDTRSYNCMRIGGGFGNLTVASGGTLDLTAGGQTGYISEIGGGGMLTIEAGATAKVEKYWNDGDAYINKFIADASGVSTFVINDRFTLRGTNSVLNVDLSNYDIANGNTLVLFDYGELLLQEQLAGDNGFGTVTLTDGWTADLVLNYDIDGNGDLGIALTNIAEPHQSLTITWDDGDGATDNWSSGANWDTGTAPADGDFVVLTATTQSVLDYAWTIASGASLTSTTSGFGDELCLQSGSSLTLATGGAMDIGFMRPRFSSGCQFIIEAGASLDTDVYGLASVAAEIKWIANATGVTTWYNSSTTADQFAIGSDNLTVDLTNYDTANGTTLVLVDYENAGVLSGTFASVTITGGFTGTIDYAYDQGGGDLAIALTNIAIGEATHTSNGTPKSWLDLYGLVVGGDYEAAGILDSDGDGRLNWQEYQDETDPTGVVMSEISFTLVEGTGGTPDTLSFAPPNTKWVVEASTDDVEWGMLPDPDVEFITGEDGIITASVSTTALDAGGTYRVVEAKKNSELIIFLTQGQSNMVGWSAKTQGYYEMDDYPLLNMYQLSRGLARLEYDPGAANTIVRAFQPLQTTRDRSGAATSYFVSPDFYFAREYAKSHPNQDVLIVKNARGGTGFVNNYWNAGDSLDVLVTPYLQAALNQVSSDYTTIRFGGIVWHQGEADAVTDGYATYAQNLTAMVARHRGFVESQITDSDAPFILGTMVPGAIVDNTTGYYDDIDAIHRDIANLVDNAGFADLSSITGRAGLHFQADGYQTAGEIYYQKWLQVTPVTGNGTPKSWLDLYGLVVGGDYEAADQLDSDGDGLLNWQEYQAGTNPTGVEVEEIAFTLVEGTGGAPDTLVFDPPNTKWVIEASTDDVEWGVVPHVTFVVNTDGSITASVAQLPALDAGGTYRVVQMQQNSRLVIFLTQGQSNMVGYAPDAPSNVYSMADHPLPNMLQLSHGHARYFYDSRAADELIHAFQPLQSSDASAQQNDEPEASLDFYFARAYAEDHPDEDVIVIKNAVGGTGFANNWWNDGDTLDALVTPYFGAAFNQNDLSNRYESIRFGGILWHQGESDTKTVAASSAYASNLQALVARHRNRVANFIANDAPFILGTMQYYRIDNYYANFPYMTTVDAVHRDIASLIPNADFVDLHDLQATTEIHFTINEYKTMGWRYYDKWLELTPLTSNGTPKSWLDLYSLVTGGDYEATDLLDSDGDGLLNWEEYVAGTDPTGGVPIEEIAVTIETGTGGEPDTLTFEPTNTKWIIEASTDQQDWGVLPDVTFVTNADGTITASTAHESMNNGGYYRLAESEKNSTIVIFLTEGQSNMVGGSSDYATNVFEVNDLPLRNMYQMSRGQASSFYDAGEINDVIRAYMPFQSSIGGGSLTTKNNSLDFYFAREYAKDHPDHDVLIVKNAIGGTGFKTADDPKSAWLEGKYLDMNAKPFIQAALNRVSSDYATIRFGGILWHQGEADAGTSSTYETNLTELAARHRGYVENLIPDSNAPFIMGTMVSRWIEERTSNYVVDAVHRNIASLVPHAECAVLDDLDQPGWTLTNHFLIDEYKIAGVRYYEKWLDIATAMEWIIPGDFIVPTGVDFADFAVFAAAWQNYEGDSNWNESCNLAEPDDLIDLADLAVFCENWLTGI